MKRFLSILCIAAVFSAYIYIYITKDYIYVNNNSAIAEQAFDFPKPPYTPAYLELAREHIKSRYVESELELLTENTAAYWDMSSSSYGTMLWDVEKQAAKFQTNVESQKFTRSFSTPLDLSGCSHFRVNAEFEDISSWSKFYIKIETDKDNYFTWNWLDDFKALFGNGEMTHDKASFRKTGNPSWNHITKISIYLGRPSDRPDTIVYIKDFYAVTQKPQNAKILFRIDDGLLSVYENAMPIFNKYNIRASCFVNPGYVLSNDHATHVSYGAGLPAMSLEELKELHSMGWSICSHTWWHDLYRDPTVPHTADNPRYSYSHAYDDITAVQAWLCDNGFADGSISNVYGNHCYNEETLQAETDVMLLGFSMHSRQSVYDTLPWGDGIRHTSSTKFFEHYIVDGKVVFPKVDAAIEHGGLTVVMCHRFDNIDDVHPNEQESVKNQGSVSPETLELCLQYISSKDNVDCITATDLAFATPIALR